MRDKALVLLLLAVLALVVVIALAAKGEWFLAAVWGAFLVFLLVTAIRNWRDHE